MIAAQVSSGSSLHAQFEPQPAPLHLRPHRRALALSVGALAIGGGGSPVDFSPRSAPYSGRRAHRAK
jgi:hypothetical protein